MPRIVVSGRHEHCISGLGRNSHRLVVGVDLFKQRKEALPGLTCTDSHDLGPSNRTNTQYRYCTALSYGVWGSCASGRGLLERRKKDVQGSSDHFRPVGFACSGALFGDASAGPVGRVFMTASSPLVGRMRTGRGVSWDVRPGASRKGKRSPGFGPGRRLRMSVGSSWACARSASSTRAV